MDSRPISYSPGKRDRNQTKWFTNQPDITKKKYVDIWAKYSLEDQQDPRKRKVFQEKLAEYIKIAKGSPKHLQIWFWDGAFEVANLHRHTAPHETGFSLRVIRRKSWSKKGKRRKVTGERSKGQVNVMGCLRYTDKKRINYLIKKGNADTFDEQLKMFNEFVKKEGVELGNKAEDFNERGPQIFMILDNASFHKRKDILIKIELELPQIRLEFLPTYSPDYNLIE